MKHFTSTEALADHVGTVTAQVLGAMFVRMGGDHPASQAIEALCTECATYIEQCRMTRELTDGIPYDLTALVVHADAPSNSETGWERD